jgi:hypothetical protein
MKGTAALRQAAEETAPQALITLSARQRDLPATIGTRCC